jgi:nucleotide-binding universal stress UspA family protein
MHKRILLAVAVQRFQDLAPQALGARDIAITLAKAYGAKVFVLTILSRLVVPIEGGETTEEKLKKLIEPMQAAKLDIEAIIKDGVPAKVILEVAEEKQADLIIIGAHTKKAPLDLSLGGVAASVLKNTPVRVILVGPSKEEARKSRELLIPEYPEIFPYV